MRKLAAIVFILLILSGLAACQSVATPEPTALPSATPTITNTPLPPTITSTPTAEPLPPLNSPNGPPLSFIRMFTAKDGWGLISNALLVTHDGGVNWFSVPLPQGQVDENTEIFFADVNNFYMVIPAADGQGGFLIHTTDGGGTWESFPVPFQRGHLTMRYNVGFFMEVTSHTPENSSFSVYVTIDFGATWSKIFPSETASIPGEGLKTRSSYISIDRAWIGVADQDQKIVLYRTDDTGKTWAAQKIAEPENIADLVTSSQAPLFFANDEQNGILAVDFVTKGSGEKNRVFYTTNDAGLTWYPGASVLDGGAYSFVDPKNGWAWGKSGVYFTNDGGQTWQLRPVAFGRSEQATCMSFVDLNTGWMLTTDAKNRVRIYNTIDSGNTWMAVNP